MDRHVLQDHKARLAKLALPDPSKTARLPGFLEQCEALVKAKPPTAIGAVAVGPWTIAMLLRNPETMLLDTFEDPTFIHDLMRVTTDFCKVWGDAITKTGIGLSFSEPTASISLIEAVGSEKLSPIPRSEEHTSELQSQSNLVCRLLLEKKK